MNWFEKLKFKLLTSPTGCRWLFNLWPPFWGTGIKVVSISNDFSQVNLLLKLRFYNRNYINTQFGGSLFSMTDPFYTFMLLNRLGKGYLICDKAAHIDYITFGRHDVKACISITDDQITEIKEKTDTGQKYCPVLPIDILDVKTGELVARLQRTLYVRKKKN